jgi:superfamily II DNA helicase RecQ
MNTATTTLPATKPPRLPMAGLEPDSPEAQLFTALRPLRRQLAADHDVRPYIILSDAGLADLVRLRPANREVLLCVKGIGPAKADTFGPALLAWIREESARLGLALTEVPIATGRRFRKPAMP